jgi:hypothetical protein
MRLLGGLARRAAIGSATRVFAVGSSLALLCALPAQTARAQTPAPEPPAAPAPAAGDATTTSPPAASGDAAATTTPPPPAAGDTAPAASPPTAAKAAAASPTSDAAEKPEPDGVAPLFSGEPSLLVSASLASGYIRGGLGGLTTAQRAPACLEFQVLGIEDEHFVVGGALRVELEGAKAVAGIVRVALRHALTQKIELRPGVGLPFYLAPKTMLGPEADIGIHYALSTSMGVLGQMAAAGFITGSDIPHGSTVVLIQLSLGLELTM